MRRLFSRLFDSGIHVSCSNICVTLSNIPYLPFTKRAALRCTISSLSELYFWRGCQTVVLYSRKDLTREKYAVSLSFSGKPFRLRLRKDKLEFALDVMTSMCFVHSKSSLTVTHSLGLGTWHPLPLQVPAMTTHIGRGWGFASWILS